MPTGDMKGLGREPALDGRGGGEEKRKEEREEERRIERFMVEVVDEDSAPASGENKSTVSTASPAAPKFRAEADGGLWRGIAELLSSLVEDALFVANADGIRVRAMDESRVSLLSVEMPPAAFESYTCQGERKICVQAYTLRDVMRRCAGNGEKVELELSEDGSRLRVRARGKVLKTFSIPLLNLDSELVKEPKVPVSVRATIPTESFINNIKDAATVSEYVKIKATNDGLEFAAGGEKGDVSIPVTRDDDLLMMDLQEESHATYSLNYLQKMAALLSETVTISFATNMPICIEYNMEKGVRIAYWLAPRVEEDIG